MGIFIQAINAKPNTGIMDGKIKIPKGAMTFYQTLKG
jgi:hypothetical protein